MVGDVFDVYELDDFGQAWVRKDWDDADGNCHGHSIGLDPHEMERVDE